jgi:hypothetical protein
MGNLDAAAHNLVGSVDYASFMDRHASAVSKNPRSMDARLKPPTSTCFPMPPLGHSIPLQYVTNGQFATNRSTHPLRYVNSSKYFQLNIDDVKEDVQDLKNVMQTIQNMLQQRITPKATVKTTVSTEPSGLTASTGGVHGPAGRY